MEERICLSYLVIVLGVLGLVCQIIGAFVPAWLTYDITIGDNDITSGNSTRFVLHDVPYEDKDTNMTISIRKGLWTRTICKEKKGPYAFGEKRRNCVTVSNVQMSQGTGHVIMDDFSELQGLVTSGAIASVFALMFAGAFVDRSATRRTRFSSAIVGTCGAMLILAAVGLQGNRFRRFNDDIEFIKAMPDVSEKCLIESFFPWAVVMSGTGALFNLLAAVFIAILDCYGQDPMPIDHGTTIHFLGHLENQVSRDSKTKYSEPSTMKAPPHHLKH